MVSVKVFAALSFVCSLLGATMFTVSLTLPTWTVGFYMQQSLSGNRVLVYHSESLFLHRHV
jgi:hypothetical protein